LTPVCSIVRRVTDNDNVDDEDNDRSAEQLQRQRQLLHLGNENDGEHVFDRLTSCLSIMTPPVVPPTLSSTLLLGVLTAAFLLPAALPLDDETEVFWVSAVVLHCNADVMLRLVNADQGSSMAINLGQSPSLPFAFPPNFFGFHPFPKCS